jgi:MFS family permease
MVFTPFEAGIFMLPVMVASGFSGPIAGVLVGRLGLRIVAAGGMGLSAVSFIGLSTLDFSTQQWQAWSLMVLLGFSAARALLASIQRSWLPRRKRKRPPQARSKPCPTSWVLVWGSPFSVCC